MFDDEELGAEPQAWIDHKRNVQPPCLPHGKGRKSRPKAQTLHPAVFGNRNRVGPPPRLGAPNLHAKNHGSDSGCAAVPFFALGHLPVLQRQRQMRPVRLCPGSRRKSGPSRLAAPSPRSCAGGQPRRYL